MIRGDISVRNLAEFVCTQGDLYPTRQGRPVTAEEGLQVQRKAQQAKTHSNGAYQSEVAFSLEFPCVGGIRKLRGRADGLLVDHNMLILEEYKATRSLPDTPHPVDLGQARIYAGLAAIEACYDVIEVQLIYVHADTLAERTFTEALTPDAAIAALDFMLLCYVSRIEAHICRSNARNTWAEQLNFPMPSFRPSQQAIARRVFRAINSGENLLLEAPTGSGKSLAVLYPAVKAQRVDEQLFFLTSRNAGAQAALAAVEQLDPEHRKLVVVEVNAKDKVCLSPDTPCDAERCKYAKGYFDRVPGAVQDLLKSRFANRSNIEEVAQAHTVCPFELSLDTALWADLIVGDYNYVFDPVVRLQRFAGHAGLHLLIDEAHQLSPRVRDMLEVDVSRDMVKEAKQISHQGLLGRVRSIDRALLKVRKQQGEGESTLTDVGALERACQRLTELVAEQDIELEHYPEIVPLYFAASRWLRSEAWYATDTFVHIARIQKHAVTVSRVCLDVAPYLREIFAEHGAAVRFSGTVSPLALYQRLHGQGEQTGQAERAQSPFARDQALVLVVNDIPTYYQARQASLPRVADLILDLCAAQPGRYLLALPSYAYLNNLAAKLNERLDQAAGTGSNSTTGPSLWVQTPGQTNAATQALIDDFGAHEAGILGIVMGGVLGESVDFANARLSGVIMISLGLPPPSIDRNLMAEYFDAQEGPGWGRMAAYTQPALVKNIQAAGRLIRAQEDFGVICLIDPRFASAEVQRFFPSHWEPKVHTAADVLQTVEKFFKNKLSP